MPEKAAVALILHGDYDSALRTNGSCSMTVA
jgi:hypothetical protein